MPVYKDSKVKTNPWYYAFEIKDTNGNRKTIKQRGFESKPDAKLAEAKSKVAIDRGAFITKNNILFGDYITSWLNSKDNISSDTRYYYQNYLDNHVVPMLGQIQLQEITSEKIKEFNKKLQDEKGLSKRTVGLIYNVINSALNDAVPKLLLHNPAKSVNKPKVDSKKMQYWNREEVKQFLTGFEHRYKIVFTIAIFTGMRIGEILGLKMFDIDLDNKIIRVRNHLISRTKTIKPGTKTDANGRSVSISPFLVAEIMKHKEVVLMEKAASGEKYKNNDLLVCTQQGSPVDDSYMRKHFIKFTKDTGVKQIRIHDLRHTCASLLLSGNKPVHPKVVQELLGHASIKMTMDLYSHLMPNMQEEAVKTLDDILV